MYICILSLCFWYSFDGLIFSIESWNGEYLTLRDVRVRRTSLYFKGLNAPIVEAAWLVVFCRSRKANEWEEMKKKKKKTFALFGDRLKSYWRDQLDILHLTERWREKLEQIEENKPWRDVEDEEDEQRRGFFSAMSASDQMPEDFFLSVGSTSSNLRFRDDSSKCSTVVSKQTRRLSFLTRSTCCVACYWDWLLLLMLKNNEWSWWVMILGCYSCWWGAILIVTIITVWSRTFVIVSSTWKWVSPQNGFSRGAGEREEGATYRFLGDQVILFSFFSLLRALANQVETCVRVILVMIAR